MTPIIRFMLTKSVILTLFLTACTPYKPSEANCFGKERSTSATQQPKKTVTSSSAFKPGNDCAFTKLETAK